MVNPVGDSELNAVGTQREVSFASSGLINDHVLRGRSWQLFETVGNAVFCMNLERIEYLQRAQRSKTHLTMRILNSYRDARPWRGRWSVLEVLVSEVGEQEIEL